MVPDEISFTIHDLRGLPMYDGDVEALGDPDSVVALKNVVRSADAVLFAAPEYNGGIPGTLKNAIDWASRGDAPMMGKPCAVIGGGGRLATARSQLMVRHILGHMGCPLLPAPTLYIAGISRSFEDGVLVDEHALAKLRELGPALVDWVNRLR
jgi:chromate reductase